MLCTICVMDDADDGGGGGDVGWRGLELPVVSYIYHHLIVIHGLPVKGNRFQGKC